MRRKQAVTQTTYEVVPVRGKFRVYPVGSRADMHCAGIFATEGEAISAAAEASKPHRVYPIEIPGLAALSRRLAR